MSDTKHTPGPWEFSGGDSAPVLHLYGPDGKGLFHESRPLDEQEANARLIAAAPDMLAALKMLDKWFEITGSSVKARWDRIPPVERAEIVKATRAAIAKATTP